MNRLRIMALAAVLGITAFSVNAAGVPDLSHAIKPGVWEYVVKPHIKFGSMVVPSHTISNKKCVTRKQLDHSRTFLANSQGKCKIESINYAGHVLTYTQKCAEGGGELTMHGRMKIDSPTSYHGTVETVGTMSGQKITGHTTLKAHRTGSCGGSGN
ncbi:MAG TPA: DUF3617 family protein [Gammaproteobacteria bacterium]|nr:DUF3617 family protein [Gammaproteobacteria bacterium]